MSSSSILSAQVPNPGYTDIPQSLSAMPNLGAPLDPQNPNWVQNAAAYTNYGEPSDYSEVGEFMANVSITYSYSIYPWMDKTHQYIQQGMLVFTSKHMNQKFKLYNMAPVWKLNIEARNHYVKANNPFEADGDLELAEFKQLLELYGEAGLEHCHRNSESCTGDLKRFYNMARKDEYRYLTKFGILSHWNFTGSVLSKGESQAPNAYLDMHSDTDICYVVGCVLGERARVGNIWGTRQHVKPGAKLFLILRRVEKADGTYGMFQWVPYATCTRDYPPKHLLSYRDESGRTCRSYVQYVGVCSENMEREPAHGQIEMAMGIMGSTEQAYEAFGSLPSIQVQIGI
jgi:hypothetical protein